MFTMTIKSNNVIYNIIEEGLSFIFNYKVHEMTDSVKEQMLNILLYQRIKNSELNDKEIIICKQYIKEIEKECDQNNENCDKMHNLYQEGIEKCKEKLKTTGVFNYMKAGYNAGKAIIMSFSKFAQISMSEIEQFVTLVSKEFKLSLLCSFRLTKYTIKMLKLYQDESIDKVEKARLYGKYISIFFKTILKLGYSLQSLIVFAVDKFLTIFLGINDLLLSLNIANFFYNFSLNN